MFAFHVQKKVVDYDYLRKHRIKCDNVAKLFIQRNEDPTGLEKRKIDDYIGNLELDSIFQIVLIFFVFCNLYANEISKIKYY